MALNGSGVAAIDSAGQPVVASTLITSAAFNALTADLATMISTCIMKDGQQTLTQNIPFNNKKITGLAAATARTDGASIATIQDGTGVFIPAGSVGGTADAITLTPSPAITAYAQGQCFRFIAIGTNTLNVTVNVSGVGVVAVAKNIVVALVPGDITSGHMVTLVYDGTRFKIGGGIGTEMVTLLGVQTLTNKTLTSPTITTPTITTPTITGVLGGLSIITRRKTADESVTSSTAVQNDDHLTFAIAANEEWIAHGTLSVGALLGTTGFKYTVTVPAAATLIATISMTGDTNDKSSSGHITSSGTIADITATLMAACQNAIATIHIWCLNGANAGNVQVQWAQSTSSVTAITVRKGSSLVANRVA